jgi:methylated-DNA-protein-cysteine methyltransferase-like protein
MHFDLNDFKANVYEVVAAIPSGNVLTYGDVARLAGWPNHARWVGRVMKNTPAELHIPCHRVVNSEGRTAPCWPEQRALLKGEGITFKANGCVDLNRWRWQTDKLSLDDSPILFHVD